MVLQIGSISLVSHCGLLKIPINIFQRRNNFHPVQTKTEEKASGLLAERRGTS
jgi:hypothetical protein